VNTSQEYPLETVAQLLTHKYDTTLDVLRQGGARIDFIPREEARSSFFHGISRSIVTRFKALLQTQITPQVNPALPPDAVVSVITDEHRQLVTYCRGYFVSTHQAFGYSTPARRSIGPGWYMFGIYTNYGPKFMDILFEVPAQTEIDLKP
jgi:hypothetical protein